SIALLNPDHFHIQLTSGTNHGANCRIHSRGVSTARQDTDFFGAGHENLTGPHFSMFKWNSQAFQGRRKEFKKHKKGPTCSVGPFSSSKSIRQLANHVFELGARTEFRERS